MDTIAQIMFYGFIFMIGGIVGVSALCLWVAYMRERPAQGPLCWCGRVAMISWLGEHFCSVRHMEERK